MTVIRRSSDRPCAQTDGINRKKRNSTETNPGAVIFGRDKKQTRDCMVKSPQKNKNDNPAIGATVFLLPISDIHA
jgi:hypothetical protein